MLARRAPLQTNFRAAAARDVQQLAAKAAGLCWGCLLSQLPQLWKNS
jgi:hypothetical protein